MDRKKPALPRLSCRAILILFAISAIAWIVVGYGIGRLLGAW